MSGEGTSTDQSVISTDHSVADTESRSKLSVYITENPDIYYLTKV